MTNDRQLVALGPTLAYGLANAVLVLHVAVAAFVVVGLVLAIAGNLRGWSWVNNIWFRVAHLAAIFVVAAEAWLGLVCPLTTLEMWLARRAASRRTTEGSSSIGFSDCCITALLRGCSFSGTAFSPASCSPPGGTFRRIRVVAFMNEPPKPSIEQESSCQLRWLPAAAHLDR
jgi:hypothetical protein